MEPYLGQLMLVPYTFVPRGWSACEGQLIAIAQNSALFSLLGTTYGGDGRTTFALPDLRGKVPMGQGNGPGLSSRRLGEQVGSESNTLLLGNLPNIPIKVNSANGTKAVPVAGDSISKTVENQGRSANELDSFNSASPDITLNARTAGGNSSPINNVQPTLVLRWVIAIVGVYPSRN